MSSKLSVVKLLIAAFIIAQSDYINCYDGWEYMKQISEEIEKGISSKHPRCFEPIFLNCDLPKSYTADNYEEYRWYYSPTYKSCIPQYVPGGEKIDCPSMNNLPKTKKECEDLCGEPCTVTYANKKTEPGICMHFSDCHIPVPHGAPNSCPSKARCCPRDYQFPSTTPVPNKTEPFKGVIIVDYGHYNIQPKNKTQ